MLAFLDPLPRFEASQPGNVLRIFERGRRDPQEIGIPNPFEDPGKPKAGLSARGLGTRNRTDPVFVGLQKTRLFDPTLNFLGTNDHAGDYRSSGCTACHVIYANDRSKVNSGPYAVFGHQGPSFQGDPTIPRERAGPSHQAQVRRDHPHQPVHRLSCPSWDECAQFLHGLHVVGRRNRRRADVPEAPETPDRGGIYPLDDVEPGRDGREGQLVRSRRFWSASPT